jgi:peroxiredoxin Q/BCP
MVKLGNKAPEFEGLTQGGKPIRLADFLGRKVILYFYPKDNTSGCTLEAKSLMEGKMHLKELGFEIVGVSPDSVKSHENFCNKHDLEFPLVADTDKSIATAYDVWKEKKSSGKVTMGTVRTTYIIDEQGIIEKVMPKVKPDTNAEEVLTYLKETI